MLPVSVITVEVLPGDVVVVIDVNIDVVIAAAVPAPIVVIIIVMVMIVIVIPIDAAEQRIGGGYTKAEAQAVNKAVGELLARSRRQINRRVGGGRPGAVCRIWIVSRYIHNIRVGGLNLNHLRRRCRSRWGCRARGCRGGSFRSGGNLLLRRGFQRPRLLGHRTKFLYRIHHILRLCQEGITEILDPLWIFAHQ